MATNIDILKCSADYDKFYYIEYEGAIRQCRLLATEGTGRQAYYILEIAGIGIKKIKPKDGHQSNWWNTSTVESVLAESPELLSKRKFINDQYGSTCNAYNSAFVAPFLPNYSVCGCGGGIHFWKWNGIRPELYNVEGSIRWRIDRKGFHCNLNDQPEERYSSKKKCEEAHKNDLKFIKF